MTMIDEFNDNPSVYLLIFIKIENIQLIINLSVL